MDVLGFVNRKISEQRLKRLCMPDDFHMIVSREKKFSSLSDSHASLIIFDTVSSELSTSDTGFLVDTIRSNTRTTDVVGWYDKGHIGLLMPDTSAEGAQRVLRGIMEHLKKRELEFPLHSTVIHTYSNGNESESESSNETGTV